MKKVAMITGAGQGIGRSIALNFAVNNKVAVVDSDSSNGTKTVSLIQEQGGDAVFIPADVSSAKQVQQATDEIVSIYGRLDYGCNNAGVGGSLKPLIDYTEDEWDRTIDINLKGVWLCMKYQIPYMLENNSGAIVNIGSTFSFEGAPEHYGYVASKHGVIGLTKCAALEFIKQGIRVNCICPGATDTPLVEECRKLNPDVIEPGLAAHPIGRIARPDEVAKAVLWLCSDEASFVVGSVLNVDGGYLA